MSTSSFNSLQTGRTFRTESNAITIANILSFNSLQTGRTFRTGQSSPMSSPTRSLVSIPFKREGLSELKRVDALVYQLNSFNSLQTGRTFRTNEEATMPKITFSFNSLQTGRTFRTLPHLLHNRKVTQFQFPSNGKDFPNSTPSEASHSVC